MRNSIVADLCHCVFSLFRGEGKKMKAKGRKSASFCYFVAKSKRCKFTYFRYFVTNSKRRNFASFRYFGAKSKRRKFASFDISCQNRKDAILRIFAFVFSLSPRNNEMAQISHHTMVICNLVLVMLSKLFRHAKQAFPPCWLLRKIE